MKKLIPLLIVQALINSSLSETLPSNHGFANPLLKVFHQFITINNIKKNITPEIGNFTREFSSENLIKVYRKSNFVEKIEGDANGRISNSCLTRLSLYASGLSNEEWALKMFDSSSKLSSGILIGNWKDLGQYDECLSIDEFNQEVGSIRGQHCMYSLSMMVPDASISISQRLSICVPSSCGAEDVEELLQYIIGQLGNQLPVNISTENVQCSQVDPVPYNTGEIITITVFSLFLCFLIGCTLYDIFLRTTSVTIANSSLKELCEFSFYTNSLRIFNITPAKGSIAVLHGIRFFSLCWVILGHEYSMVILGAMVNMAEILTWSQSWPATAMFIAVFAVDSFFVLSGFLTSYLFMKEMSKGCPFNIILYYLHRYIRLTPALAALILMSIYIIPRWGSGALWQSLMMSHSEDCKKNWWPMLLYVQNYVWLDANVGCLGHTWYLAVDMNLFWISPLILYPLAKKPKIGLVILTGFIVASIIIPAVVVAENKYPATFGAGMRDITQIQDMMRYLYMASHTRAGAWLLGVLLGYILSKKQNPKVKLIIIGWISAVLAFAFAFFTYRIFQSKTYQWNAPWEIFYAGLSRHIWAFGVCWLIYSSVVGYGGVISRILSWPIYLPFTRISYSIYLIHYILQIMKTSSSRTPVYFSDGGVFYAFFAELIVCIVAGLALSLVFESPFLVLERMIFKRPKKSNDQQGYQGNTNGGYVQEPTDAEAIVKNQYA